MVGLAGCELGDPSDGAPVPDRELVHPVAERLLSADDSLQPREVSLQNHDGEETGAGVSLRGFESSVRFGVLDEPAAEVLGSIVGGVLLRDGSVAVVDRNFGVVRWFSEDLQPLAVIGTSGDGPGEFVNPVGVQESLSGDLWVANHLGSRLRLERFARMDDGFEFESRELLNVVSDDGARFCISGDRILASGLDVMEVDGSDGRNLPYLSSGSFVHELSLVGEQVGGMPSPYSGLEVAADGADLSRGGETARYELSSNVEIALIFSTIRIDCTSPPAEGKVSTWVGYSALGEIHALDPMGRVVWIVRLTDQQGPRMVQRIHSFGTSVGLDTDQSADEIEMIESVVQLSSNILAVSVRSRNGDGFRTYLLDPSTGALIDGFISDHMVLAGRGGRVLLYREFPHPELALMELE